jgi:acyl transferase domain-containing protein/NAD(P)-dependent dehydrogenase (short-subunit alcohol dehydrogenase family)/NAD(P)H-dependent flavin oxidoreductase YrpB (nitropropane dioxygenase family)
MTRVSDKAAFAAEVAEAGGLPFLALALMHAPDVEALLKETGHLLGDRPWGVGILGFVPLELRQEQLEVIRTYRPPFALIAGGRPDQALALEQQGIPTYLHVPSPGLLKMFVESGARRFVFEGRECGGHVGPRSSFVLWNTMIDVLRESLQGNELVDCHILFAAGIHDAISASMVATMAAPLAERGARIGVLLGTAYLFTEEAVSTGAIVKGFQEEAIRCTRTVLLETGPGHSTRCVDTPYAEMFERQKRGLLSEGKSPEEIRNALEELNLGRLRIASKGVAHNPAHEHGPTSPRFVTLSTAQQQHQGMYMIGQVAALRDRTCTITELHHNVSVQGSERLREVSRLDRPPEIISRKEQPCDVAIIGMACLLPKADNLNTFWQNILNKVDAITEVPGERWDWRLYFDSDPKVRDKVYSKWGGFIDPVPFDPTLYGMPPNTLHSIEPLQLLTLEVVRKALEDAGYINRQFPRERASVILGVGGGAGDLGQQYALRSGLPMILNDPPPEVWSKLPEWTEDSFAGILLNVAAGRVANRFDLGGVNYTVDAACASSLAAVYLATRELEAGTSDMVIVGGADTVQNPFAYLCFSKTYALSPRGRCRAFDESADGIVISEGLGVLVLKRLADAERDGDRIYAVIKAVAGSSDGRDKGLTAPRPEGQFRALDRAYAKAGFSPATVGLIEAHGTGTVAGDQAEVESLRRVFEAADAKSQSCAVGSVKSMIGHTKCTAGVAGMIKVALALYHQVLPPTINVEKPNTKARFDQSPFFVNTEPRPWIRGETQHPRRGGVSSFGFGGTNFHAVLEEYTGDFLETSRAGPHQELPSEIMLWAGSSRQEILEAIESLQGSLARGAAPALRELSYTLWELAKGRASTDGLSILHLAVVTNSLSDLRQKLLWASEKLRSRQASIYDPRGIYFTENPLAYEGKIAFLFPGQGSQYVDMLCDLAIQFPEVRERFEIVNRVLADRFSEPLSSYVFPPPRFSPEEKEARQQALTQTHIAQPAMGAADMALFYLLETLGVRPTMVAGHSYGEYVALCAAGVFGEEVLYKISEARGRFIHEAAQADSGTMAAVEAGRESLSELLRSVEGVWIANLNSPKQTIISGTRPGVEEAVKWLKAQGIGVRPVAVACAFHSPLIAPARDRLAEFLSTVQLAAPQLDVFSNTSAGPYPYDPKAFARLLADHLILPVEFAREVEAMYDAGARIFVEVGPRNVLTSLTQQILGERPCLAVALDMPGRSGLGQLQHALAQLAAHGVSVQLGRLYQGRTARRLNLVALEEQTKEKPLPPTTWWVSGGQARPPERTSIAPRVEASATVKNSSPDKGDGKMAAEPLGTKLAPKGAPSPIKPDGDIPSISSVEAKSVPISDAALTASKPKPMDESHQVMMQYQKLMNRFLETQKEVMLAYLRGAPEGRAVTRGREISGTIPATLSTQPQAPLGLRADGPSSLPVDEAPVTKEIAAPQTEAGAASIEPSKERAAAPKPEQSSADKEYLTRQLLQIVCERTGYPPEMLDLNLNMEADLGIDSIKRVEIIGAFQRSVFPPDQQKTQEAMEKLAGIKTLRGIIDWVHSALQIQPETPTAVASSNKLKEPVQPIPAHGTDSEVEISRFLLASVEAPPKERALPSVIDGTFLITDDGQGAANTLAEKLRCHGARVALVQMDQEAAKLGQDVYKANLTDPASVAKLLQIIRVEGGSIRGLIHLLPWKTKNKLEEMDLAGWKERLALEIKSLFYLAKGAGTDLNEAAKTGISTLVAATAMGGSFAIDSQKPQLFFPGQGGLAGLVKTLAVEWPSVHCKVVDLEPEASASTVAEYLLGEIVSGDKTVEVGYRDSRRFIFRPSRAPLMNGPTTLPIDSSWVILVTGGARGITAEVACELAALYRPMLLLVGRSPLPEPQESPDTARLTSPQDLKKALMERMRQGGERVTPAQVETAYTRLLQDREMRRTLTALRDTGATVRYDPVDVRDEQAFGNFIDGIYQSYGRIDGVIHGAGVIEDKLILDKTADSFHRVFDTKADSAFILSRKLRPESLKFLAFFSSVAGRFGNRGQGDYAAANEVLNKLAIYLDGRWPGRVVSMNWGPWAKAGMVSDEVQRQFSQRGVQLIPPVSGRRIFDQEIQFGRKGQIEVVLGDGPWEAIEPAKPTSTPESFPLVVGAPLKLSNGSAVELTLILDPRRDRYLQDHRLDGKPVFPAAMAVELMAEVVQRAWPELEMVGLRSMRVLQGIVLGEEPREIHVMARPQTEPPYESLGLEVDVEISELTQRGRPSYRATVQLADRLPSPSPYDPSVCSKLRPFPMSVEEAYRDWLFHGPSFQGIAKIEGLNEGGICAVLFPSSPGQCLLQNGHPGHWLIDPVLLDCGFQLAILWERSQHDMTPLPSSFTSYRRFGDFSGSEVHCYLQARSTNAGHTLLTDITFLDPAGRMVGFLEGMEFSCSKALNRLAGFSVTNQGDRS